jgi:hypothetical protein
MNAWDTSGCGGDETPVQDRVDRIILSQTPPFEVRSQVLQGRTALYTIESKGARPRLKRLLYMYVYMLRFEAISGKVILGK